ncbi:MAG: type 4a pilus biogenesis protein PilO [Calditrichaceae bacterium]
MAKKLFFILIILQIFIFGIGYFILDPVLNKKIKNTESELAALVSKLKSAKTAQAEMSKIKNLLQIEQGQLEKIKLKYVKKTELAKVTEKLNVLARQNNIVITDFSPVLNNYFDQAGNSKINPMPFLLEIKGGYLDTGKFLENFENLPFYLVPGELEMEKSNQSDGTIVSKVSVKLYTWNN